MNDLPANRRKWKRSLNRRRFLRGALAAGAGLLAACAPADTPLQSAPNPTATPFRALTSPQPPEDETPEPVPEGSISLQEFLEFSSLLTGVDNLDPALGLVYLRALESGGGAGSGLAEAYGAASTSGPLPQNVDELSSGGFFDQEGMGELADQIISMWYTGVYQVDGEDRVATFVDALAWKVLHFTKPLTTCAHFGFWSEEPRVQLTAGYQYTPVPTQPAGGEGGGS